MSFCNKLKRIRKTYQYSQQELAAQIGLSRGHYSNIETGKMPPSDTVLICLSLIFHLSKDYLTSDDDDYSEIDISYQNYLSHQKKQVIMENPDLEKLLNTVCHLNKDYQEFLLLSANSLLDIQNKRFNS